MFTTNYYFSEVTLLITHYNRSKSLENLLKTFKEQNCTFEEVIVSDDGSRAEHLEVVEQLAKCYSFKLIKAPVNKGLGNNINKGQDAIATSYTLYIQEDFEPAESFPLYFNHAVQLMKERNDLDLIRFYSYLRYPYLKPYKNGFSEMYIPVFALNYNKIYNYSDHPHLRRSTFTQKFGRYIEGIKGDRTEYKMCLSFIKNRGKGLIFDRYQELFIQRNSTAEPSSMSRSKLTNSNHPFIKIVRDIYRQVKYNFDLNF